MNHAGSSGPTNADAILPDFSDEDFYMDHPVPGPSALSNDGPLAHNSGSPITMGEDLDEAYGQSISCCLVKLLRIFI